MVLTYNVFTLHQDFTISNISLTLSALKYRLNMKTDDENSLLTTYIYDINITPNGNKRH